MAAHEAVRLQLEITAKVPKGFKLSEAVVDAAVKRWAETGASVAGFDIKIIDWENTRGTFEPQSQEEARVRFRRLLQQGRYTFRLRRN